MPDWIESDPKKYVGRYLRFTIDPQNPTQYTTYEIHLYSEKKILYLQHGINAHQNLPVYNEAFDEIAPTQTQETELPSANELLRTVYIGSACQNI